MKYLYLIILLFISFYASAQKLVINEIGFKLKAEERGLIERLALYEVKIFNGLFLNNKNDSTLLTLNLYNKQKDFKELLKSTNNKGFTESGFYSPITNQSYVLYYDKDEIHTVLHELSHALLRNNLKNPPRWFNEGLAVFLQSLEENKNSIQVYTQHQYLDLVKNEISKNFDLRSFLFNEQNLWRDKSQLKYMYAKSYSIIYLIIKRNPQLISKMAAMMNKGIQIETIFNELFGSIESFQNNYKVFYR